VNDVLLTGVASRIAGSTHQTRAAILRAKGTQESRIDLGLSSGGRAQIGNRAFFEDR
jgi:hypothetical protein